MSKMKASKSILQYEYFFLRILYWDFLFLLFMISLDSCKRVYSKIEKKKKNYILFFRVSLSSFENGLSFWGCYGLPLSGLGAWMCFLSSSFPTLPFSLFSFVKWQYFFFWAIFFKKKMPWEWYLIGRYRLKCRLVVSICSRAFDSPKQF